MQQDNDTVHTSRAIELIRENGNFQKDNAASSSPVNSLPGELQIRILWYLGVRDLFIIRQVSRGRTEVI